MKKKRKNKGYLFWLTGLSGSGKSSIAKTIKPEIQKKIGPTLVINGDNLRKIYKLNKYDKKSRLNYTMQYSKVAKFITDQNINVIFATVGMFDKARNWNRKNIDNYIEIFIKSDITQIRKNKKKKLYLKKVNSIVGIQIKPEFPKKPDIVISNNFEKSINELSKSLIKKIFG